MCSEADSYALSPGQEDRGDLRMSRWLLTTGGRKEQIDIAKVLVWVSAIVSSGHPEE